jgi:hypothetical protein
MFISSTNFRVQASQVSNINGIISSDITWTKENSPYTLTGNVLIDRGITLTIQPGAIIDLGGHYIEVNGTIRAIGNEVDEISINNGSIEFGAASSSWNEQTSKGSVIENAVINNSPINIINASPKISYNIISSVGSLRAIFINKGAPTISFNSINGNIGTEESLLTPISNNVVTGNIAIAGSGTVSDNVVYGYISVGGSDGFSQVINNTVFNGISVGYDTNVITNNTINGGLVGISLPTTFVSNNPSNVSWNYISDCETGIKGNTGNPVTAEGNTIVNSKNYGIEIINNKTIFPLTWNITGNLIMNCGFGIYGAAQIIDNNLIMKNNYGLYGEATIIRDNTIAQNSIGVAVNSMGFSSSPVIFNNNIQSSSNYSLYLTPETAININATYNWWGTIDSQVINQAIYDFKNDFNLGKVSYNPFLTAPNSQAPNMNLQSTLPTPTSTNPPQNSMIDIQIAIILVATLTLIFTAVIVIYKRKQKLKR